METQNIQSFLFYYNKVRKRTNRLLAVVSSEHLDFAYKQGKFTVSDQIRHIAAIERYMFAETISGRKSLYRGCGKELADGYENIMNFFNQSHKETLEIISQLNDEDLKRYCHTPTGTEIEIGKWLQLLAEHEIHHRAQLYIYMNML
ncbi:MAG: DinB family protein, partial [Chitinophagaceae bacterium]